MSEVKQKNKPMPSAEELKEYFEDAGNTVRWIKNIGASKVGGLATGKLQGYYTVTLFGRRMLVHRVLYKMRTGCEPECLDHIDGDRLNNAQENLRPASVSQNGQNRPIQRNSSSGFKNVTKWPRSSKWMAKVRLNGKVYREGPFDCIHDADKAAQTLRKSLHKEFAHD